LDLEAYEVSFATQNSWEETIMSTQLQFRQDGSFTIVQFTDIHWKDGSANDWCTDALIREVITAEKPDLIVITGDVIHKKETPQPLSAFRQALSAITDSGIPWAFVFGNHELEAEVEPDQLVDILQQLPNSLFETGPSHIQGLSNYVLPIRGSRSEATCALLYLLDTGAKTKMPFGGATWVHRNQIDWYLQQSAAMTERNGGSPLPALAFFHIPLPEYNEIWDFRICYGSQNKGIDSPRINSGLFAAMVEMGDVMGTFVGHDHLNDFYGDLHGIRLCYSRLSGFSGKAPEDFPRGARVIKLHEGERSFETWQRLDDGSVLSEVPVHLPEGIDRFGKRSLGAAVEKSEKGEE
jgi:hypothetical protein